MNFCCGYNKIYDIVVDVVHLPSLVGPVLSKMPLVYDSYVDQGLQGLDLKLA